MYRPTDAEKFAIEARLNMILGAKEYDRLFLGFECGELKGDVVNVYARSEYCALRIDSHYSPHVAAAVASVIRRPVRTVNVRLKSFSDSKSN